MAVCKESRSTGVLVIVDTTKNDAGKLPAVIRDGFEKAGNFWPKVVLADPALTKVYGSYPYEQLKPQKFRTLFRDGKKAFEADAKAGVLVEPGAAAPDKPGDKDAPAQDPPAMEGKDFVPSEMAEWRSSKGTTIKAKLVALDPKGRYLFETADGRKIPVAADQLDEDSRKRAEAVVNSADPP